MALGITDKQTPHATLEKDGWTWKVLETYQKPLAEKKNKDSRWHCFVTSPLCPEGEYGDVYIREIFSIFPKLTQASERFHKEYSEHLEMK